MLLDVIADEAISPERLSRYPVIVLADVIALSDDQVTALRDYAAAGGKVQIFGEPRKINELGEPASRQVRGVISRDFGGIGLDRATADAHLISFVLKKFAGSIVKAPWTVRVAAYTQPNRLIAHLVNYDRDETPNRKLQGPELERPKAVDDIHMRIRLPEGRSADSVILFSPDRTKPLTIPFQQTDGLCVFRVPTQLVYAVISIDCQAQ